MQHYPRSMAVVLVIALLLFCNCGKSGNFLQSDAKMEQSAAKMEFFPIQIGTSWTYKIEVGDIMPLECRETYWLETHRFYRERRQLQGASETKKVYSLQFRITGNSAPQWWSKPPVARELTVEKDEIRIFGGAKQVFWDIAPGALFPVTEMRVFDSSNGPVGVQEKGEGYQRKYMVLFCENQPLPVVIDHYPPEKMICYGIETNVPGLEGTECLHVQREIKADEGKSDKLSKGWTEDMWFVKGKGLVRLIQRIDGKTSMTWNLDQFSSEPE